MNRMGIVLDTSVLVAALRSRLGASFQVLSHVGTSAFDLVISVPLVLEYEDALIRNLPATSLDAGDVADILDYVCRVGLHQEIFFLWRPVLRDPSDDLVLEVAVAGGCDAIVTHNVRDFRRAESFNVRVLTPGAFLERVKGKQ